MPKDVNTNYLIIKNKINNNNTKGEQNKGGYEKVGECTTNELLIDKQLLDMWNRGLQSCGAHGRLLHVLLPFYCSPSSLRRTGKVFKSLK